MRSNEDLIDREETLSHRKCVVKVALAHLPFNEKREVCDVMMENSTFTVKKDVELKREYPSIIEERRIVNVKQDSEINC